MTDRHVIAVPLRLGRGGNTREHHMQRARRVRAEREAVAWCLYGQDKPPTPCVVLITRITPSPIPMDDDNLASACKGVRDAIAEWLGIDDKHDQTVRYRYAQRRGPWGTEIEFLPAEPGMQAAIPMPQC